MSDILFTLTKAASVLSRPLRRALFARRELARMVADGDPLLARVATAVECALEKRLQPAEREWVDRIEAHRRELQTSTKPVDIMDYGVGTSTTERTAEQMSEGQPHAATVGEICRSAAKKPGWALLLFELVRQCRPSTGLEMGCSLGMSAAYQAAAMVLNGEGRLTTLEGDETLAALATENFRRLGLDNVEVRQGRFSDTLQNTLEALKTVDYVFVDGHHDRDATLAYFDQVHPFLSKGAMVVFDDTYWTRGMREAWGVLENDGRFAITIDLLRLGIGIVSDSAGAPRRYSIAID